MSRRVKIGTVSLQYRRDLYGMEYFDYMVKSAEEYLYNASINKPDLMVLPEDFAHLQIRDNQKRKFAEIIPDANPPLQKKMSQIAKGINSNLVFGITEVSDDKFYNSVVVCDRKGEYVGKYRKMHLCPTEKHFYTPGDKYTVLDLDIGKLGIAICMDIHYPEMWRIMALMGSDIIAHPTGWLDYTGDFCESILNARAIDNQNYIVTSHLVEVPYLAGKLFGHSRVVDPYGRTRADTSHIPGYAIANVDLDELYEYWGTGELKKKYPTLKDCFFDMRKPETYDLICREDIEKKWKIKNSTLYSK